MPGRLPRRFYDRPAKVVAPDLIGKFLCTTAADGVVRRARIVETEAYVGQHDLASHARFGRTPRNATMWGPPGHFYVYLVYGMHHCANVVTSANGDPQAVLLRAAEPLDGWAARLSGPALLAKSFGLTRAHDGLDLGAADCWIEEGTPPRRVLTSARIGVAYAGAWARSRLRFVDADSLFISGAPGKRRTFKAARIGPRDG